jgi:hypothetical protein
MCLGIQAVLEAGRAGACDVVLIEYREGDESPSLSQAERVAANRAELHQLVAGRGHINAHEVRCWSEQGQRVGAHQVLRLFDSPASFRNSTDVVVDVSALPRGLYFPLLARLLYWVDNWQNGKAPNLHVLVAEDPERNVWARRRRPATRSSRWWSRPWAAPGCGIGPTYPGRRGGGGAPCPRSR